MNPHGLRDLDPLGNHKHPCASRAGVYIGFRRALNPVDPSDSSYNLYVEPYTSHQGVEMWVKCLHKPGVLGCVSGNCLPFYLYLFKIFCILLCTSQYILVHYSISRLYISYISVYYSTFQYITVYYSILQYITVHYSTLQYITVHYSTLQYVSVYLVSTFQYITGYYSTVQYIAVYHG